jgi:hypothetical protein
LAFSYFDLKQPAAALSDEIAQRLTSNNFMIFQYATLVGGIIVQPFFTQYQETKTWNVNDPWGWMVFSVIVGLVVFPAVYRRAFDSEKPLFVQLCTIFVAGLGWQSLLTTAIKLTPVAVAAPGAH